MKKIIIINGSGTSGKDTIVEMAANIAYNKKLRFGRIYGDIYNISSVDEVKKIATTMGWNGGKNSKDRKFLSDLKDLWTEFNNGPLNYIIKTVENCVMDSDGTSLPFKKLYEAIIFVHIREPREIKRVVDFYGNEATTLLIKRDDVEKFDNHADEEVDKYDYDNIIYNNGTLDELGESVEKYLEEILD